LIPSTFESFIYEIKLTWNVKNNQLRNERGNDICLARKKKDKKKETLEG